MEALKNAIDDFTQVHRGVMSIAAQLGCGSELLEILGVERLAHFFAPFSSVCERVSSLTNPARRETRDAAVNFGDSLDSGYAYPIAEMQKKTDRVCSPASLGKDWDHYQARRDFSTDYDKHLDDLASFGGVPSSTGERSQPQPKLPDSHPGGRYGRLVSPREPKDMHPLTQLPPPDNPASPLYGDKGRDYPQQSKTAHQLQTGYDPEFPGPTRIDYNMLQRCFEEGNYVRPRFQCQAALEKFCGSSRGLNMKLEFLPPATRDLSFPIPCWYDERVRIVEDVHRRMREEIAQQLMDDWGLATAKYNVPPPRTSSKVSFLSLSVLTFAKDRYCSLPTNQSLYFYTVVDLASLARSLLWERFRAVLLQCMYILCRGVVPSLGDSQLSLLSTILTTFCFRTSLFIANVFTFFTIFRPGKDPLFRAAQRLHRLRRRCTRHTRPGHVITS